ATAASPSGWRPRPASRRRWSTRSPTASSSRPTSATAAGSVSASTVTPTGTRSPACAPTPSATSPRRPSPPASTPAPEPGARRAGSGQAQPFDGLAGQVGDELEVLVEVQDGETGELRRRRDEQVGHGRCPVLAPLGQRGLHL